MHKFVYFWIPTYFEFNCNLRHQAKEQNISDDVENKQNILKLEFLENYDIKVKYNSNEYILKYILHESNGLFIYEFSNIDEELLKIQVYHLFKDICHIHNSHDNEEDSLLNAYISDNDKDIDNAVRFYCEIYIDKFKEYENVVNEFIDLNTNDFKIDEIKNQKELLLKAKEEILYALFLSKDTEIYNTFISFEKRFNILIEKLHLKETKKLFKVNDTINRWQFGLAILGIGLGLYFGFNSANDKLQKIENEKIEKISKDLKQQSQLLQKIDNVIKDINQNVNYNKIKINKILHNTELAISQNNNKTTNIIKNQNRSLSTQKSLSPKGVNDK